MKKTKGGFLDDDDQDEEDDYGNQMPEEYENQMRDNQQKMSNNVLSDLKELQQMENEVPNTHKEKDLRACVRCKLILSEQ